MLSVAVGCTNKGTRSDAGSFEKFYQHLEQISADSPEQVSQTIDSVMPAFKDSVMYYRLLLLKVRTCFLTFNLDSASIYLDRVLSFCERNKEDNHVYPLYAFAYNARGNIYVRTSQVDSACSCF